MGVLYIVATPIGNLEDITVRALRILKEVDIVLAEDTRVTQKLLHHYEIQKSLVSYHQHSDEKKKEEILFLLSQGKNIALVTDAGTPGISDPGNELVSYILSRGGDAEVQSTKTEQLRQFCTPQIVPVPGPSAVAALASVAGIAMDKFLFLGYPPHKKGRKMFFEEVVASEYPVIFYESPYRVIKSLQALQVLQTTLRLRSGQALRQNSGQALRQNSGQALRQNSGQANYQLQTAVGRELTKKFEEITRGSLDEVLEILYKKKQQQGEFVLLVFKK